MGNDHKTMIFSTEKGIVALDSPVKLKILEILKNGTRCFDDIVEQSGKAKSTISVHLDDLEKLNLILEKTYTEDKRKKYFILNSICLACSEPPLREQYYKHLDTVKISGFNGDSFMKHIFHTIRFGMEAYGFNPKPIMKRLGMDMGTKIGNEFDTDNYYDIMTKLSLFWKANKLGNMTVDRREEAEILITDCYHCSKMPNVGKTLCSMDEGLIEGVFSSCLDIQCNVKETECYGTGYDHCKFVIEEK
ncbi:MAG: ArsR family transcriptional regulator [Candidatus Methanoperedens sp.]|nr:ArsR family transcriptional regulator [Candidatus Methanoperedens sp.]MCE8428149.1 ArsR family transcriptional regulator [Candidatus Methanoperedens sp.]